ncbi:hypothetical protein NPIL_92021 [Nephila pilipes]|uniref:Uncharacterized protein n=1 Tax=Nephila pilipes TaxID=299642 RepID=A0A8X6P4D7_NEPPI|nr:hypothetical protein NPIL_92021 [Nephila pilipes]
MKTLLLGIIAKSGWTISIRNACLCCRERIVNIKEHRTLNRCSTMFEEWSRMTTKRGASQIVAPRFEVLCQAIVVSYGFPGHLQLRFCWSLRHILNK